jgi:hypothetical protein
MEAKYIATSKAVMEAIWIRNFVSELSDVPSAPNHVDLYCDNSGAIAQAKEPRSHKLQTCTTTLSSYPWNH